MKKVSFQPLLLSSAAADQDRADFLVIHQMEELPREREYVGAGGESE
jgi:hypothetical protein